ncbi:MAG: response regulator, partial [Proteobacteria bacterium]
FISSALGILTRLTASRASIVDRNAMCITLKEEYMSKLRPLALIIDDNWEYMQILKATLDSTGFDVETCESVASARDIKNKDQFAVVFLDDRMPNETGMSYLSEACRQFSRSLIIVMSTCSSLLAQKVVQQGAYGFYEKCSPISSLLIDLLLSLEKRRL